MKSNNISSLRTYFYASQFGLVLPVVLGSFVKRLDRPDGSLAGFPEDLYQLLRTLPCPSPTVVACLNNHIM